MKEPQKLNITFHNPNTAEEFIKELIKVSAEVAKKTVEDKILHIEESPPVTYPQQVNEA